MLSTPYSVCLQSIYWLLEHAGADGLGEPSKAVELVNAFQLIPLGLECGGVLASEAAVCLHKLSGIPRLASHLGTQETILNGLVERCEALKADMLPISYEFSALARLAFHSPEMCSRIGMRQLMNIFLGDHSGYYHHFAHSGGTVSIMAAPSF